MKSVFWNKFGRWQLLAVVVTLITFFITRHLTSDKKWAIIIAALVTACTMLANAVYAAIKKSSAPLPAALAFVIAGYAAITAIMFPLVVFAGFAALILIGEVEKCGLKKRVVCLSCAAEFAAAFLPILLVH